MNFNRRRIAINKAQIAKKCAMYGPLLEGSRAFRAGAMETQNPYLSGSREHEAWIRGWILAEDKENDR